MGVRPVKFANATFKKHDLFSLHINTSKLTQP